MQVEEQWMKQVLPYLYKYGSLAVMALIIIYFSLVSDVFLSYNNFSDILRAIAIVTVLALGVTFTLIVNGFDLSVGSTMSLATVVSASLMVWYELPLWLVILLPLLVGAAIGLINAFFILVVGVPDLLATLSVMYIVAGLQSTYTEGYSIYNHMPLTSGATAPGEFNELFLWLGQGYMLNVPVPVWIMLSIVLLSFIVLRYTTYGRILYLTGGNEQAAKLAGIRVARVKLSAYVISGVFASIAGILFAARVGSGQIDAGAPLLMEAVAAVFVGYSVLGIGKPNAIGTFLGAATIGILLNGLTIQNLPYYAFDIVKGVVLLVALSVTYLHLKHRFANS